MTIPTRTEILTMDYSHMGSPWVNVVAKPGIDVDGLDYSYMGEPWWGVEFTNYTLLGSSSKHVHLSSSDDIIQTQTLAGSSSNHVHLSSIGDIIQRQFLTGASSNHVHLSNVGIILNILRPISDIYIGNWTTETGGSENLFESINELVADDLDYIQSELSSTSSSVVFELNSTTDPNVHTGHFFRYRYKRNNDSEQQTLTAMLKQGNSTIGSWVHNNISDSWTTAEQELTEVQAESISDYTNLSIEFIAETV